MVTVKYGWKKGSQSALEAQTAGKHLSKLHKENGMLTADLVVKDAKPLSSPLHDHFEWDNTEAAKEYRLYQARKLIHAVVILKDNGEPSPPMRAFVHIRDEEVGSIYMSIDIAMGDSVLRAQIVERAWTELKQWEARYHQYEELAGVFEAIEKARG